MNHVIQHTPTCSFASFCTEISVQLFSF